MRLFLVLITALLACNNFVEAVGNKQTRVSPFYDHSVAGRGNDERNLRSSEVDQDNDTRNVSEERGGAVSTFATKVSDKVPLSLKMEWWSLLEKPSSAVKKKLGLEGLTGTALTSHKNYQRFLHYQDKLEKSWLRQKSEGGFSTYSFWKEQGLDSVTSVDDLRRIQNTEEFRKYKRYVLMFDRNVESTKGSGYNMPKFLDKDATAAEMTARVQIWAETGKSDQYVKMMLGLENVRSDRLANKPYYPYYEYFLTLKKRHTT